MNRILILLASLFLVGSWSFPATAAGLSIKNPSSKTTYCKKQSIPIRWRSEKAGNWIRIELLKSGIRYKTIKSRYRNTGAFNWPIPTSVRIGNGYSIRVSSLNKTYIKGKSTAFSIAGERRKCKSYDVVTVQAAWKSGANGLANAAALDLDGDGDEDIVNSPFGGINDSKTYPIKIFLNQGNYIFKKYSSKRSAIKFDKKPRASFGRDILVADINQDGFDDFYVADATECSGSTICPPFEGGQQFAYISKSAGRYKKVYLGFGKVTAHGYGIADVNSDGYPDIIFNTLGNARPAKPNIGIAIYDPSKMRFSQSRIKEPDGMSSDWWGKSLYFYTAVLDVNNDGAIDVIALSPDDLSDHRIFLGDGRGNFTFDRTFGIGGSSKYLKVESVAVGDFNGDGYSDFAALAQDRNPSTWKSGSKAIVASWLQVFINNKKGSFFNASKRFLGSKYQNRRLGSGNFYLLYALDANQDGKTDLAVTPSVGPPYKGEFSVLISDGKKFQKRVVAKNAGPRLLIMNEHGTKKSRPQILFEHEGKVKMVLFRY
jgi:hypothetical protein